MWASAQKLATNLMLLSYTFENSIRDARTPQSREIVFNTMRYRSSETVQRLIGILSEITFKWRK